MDKIWGIIGPGLPLAVYCFFEYGTIGLVSSIAFVCLLVFVYKVILKGKTIDSGILSHSVFGTNSDKSWWDSLDEKEPETKSEQKA